MPTVILKKTFKIKPAGFQVANEKSFTFHGSAVTDHMIGTVNQRLATIRYTGASNHVQFGGSSSSHYAAQMNHDCQKYNEEDVICGILDAMEQMGWKFRFQYDSESQSVKLSGSSMTFRELFIFEKPLSGSELQNTSSMAASGAGPVNLRIAAPKDTPEGQTFTASYEGRRFQVTAPAGGLKKNQIVTVPAPFN